MLCDRHHSIRSQGKSKWSFLSTFMRLLSRAIARMPTTRSATVGSRPAATVAPSPPKAKATVTRKRKAAPEASVDGTAKKTKKASPNSEPKPQESVSFEATNLTLPGEGEGEDAPVLVPAVLTFDFEEAKQHLISVDHRFGDVFRRMKCKPYEHLERVHPFRFVFFIRSCISPC